MKLYAYESNLIVRILAPPLFRALALSRFLALALSPAPSRPLALALSLARPGLGPAGRGPKIDQFLIRILIKIGPDLAQPAGSSKLIEF